MCCQSFLNPMCVTMAGLGPIARSPRDRRPSAPVCDSRHEANRAVAQSAGVERALPWEGAEVAMNKTSPRSEKDLEPRRKLRLIKGGLWGANPKALDDRKGASPLLTKACATGQHYPTVVITT